MNNRVKEVNMLIDLCSDGKAIDAISLLIAYDWSDIDDPWDIMELAYRAIESRISDQEEPTNV